MNALADLPLYVIAERDRAMRQVSDNAGPNFKSSALRFVVSFLRENGETSGEVITDAAKAAGIVPHCDKAFGPVYQTLLKDKLIERTGYCLRVKGNGTFGASVYRITK